MKTDNNLHTVFVCVPSPPQGADTDEKRDALHRGMRACHLLAKLGYSPLCPLLYFPRFLSTIHAPDVADAAVLKQEWLEMSEEVWVFGDERTKEMACDIQMAKELELPIRYYPEPDELRVRLLEALEVG